MPSYAFFPLVFTACILHNEIERIRDKRMRLPKALSLHLVTSISLLFIPRSSPLPLHELTNKAKDNKEMRLLSLLGTVNEEREGVRMKG